MLQTEDIIKVAQEMRLHLKLKPANSHRSVRLQDLIEEYVSPNWRSGLIKGEDTSIPNPHLETSKRAETAAKLQVAFKRYKIQKTTENVLTFYYVMH